MDGSIVLRPGQRKRLLDVYRDGTDPDLRLRAHILLLLADQHPWLNICLMLYCSSATIARWKKRDAQGGIEAVLGGPRAGRRPILWSGWALVVVRWVQTLRPMNFGYLRSRWCCATLTLVLWEVHRLKVSPETVRRWLAKEQMVWRRPRPVLERKDPRWTGEPES